MNAIDPNFAMPRAFSAADIVAAHRAAGAQTLVAILEQQSGMDAEEFVAALAATVKLPVCTMGELNVRAACFDRLSFGEALRMHCIPVRDADSTVKVVVADPFDNDLRDRLSELFVHLPPILVAHSADIAARLNRHEDTSTALDGMGTMETTREAGAISEISLKTISADTSPVVRLVNSTLHDALKAGASDVHMETSHTGMTIKCRVDGVLVAVGEIPGVDLAEQAISRIKVMAELDISERRVPQDGRFRVNYQGREIDLRVSIMPSIHGEDAVLRILDRRALSAELAGLTLGSLGFSAATIEQLRDLSEQPYGMLLVTGPTGSGKTTTLYGAIGEINHGRDKIITIEDPVEYQLSGVLQIPVNEKKGLTFARGLRSILRHDPDKIMVGEIRDGETAQIAVQAALTGHLVFTTVHANNAFDVLGRFTHMGVDPYSLVAALNGVVAQRLLRVNCPECTEDVTPDPRLLARSGIVGAETYRFRAGRGCGHCLGTGYKGRKAVAEVLILDDELRDMITNRESVSRIKESVRAKGGRFLRDAALDMARDGETSLEEVNRVVA
ncbi:GspE/PulE family protein [Dechloromonas sp. HYN0024]|uniref:GspE/PulE family protein n=1 Tax=Dechloromonas sp. HYN0024 TaxID=2231055 RepID=UPI000E42F3B5|nr:GspE/PulE family protein [Dechloromonas sp. HYN0024]AXS80145.1 type II/IV secretion system protein [Dechloromonas sp. HYN0024]